MQFYWDAENQLDSVLASGGGQSSYRVDYRYGCNGRLVWRGAANAPVGSNQRLNAIDVIDTKTWKVIATWPIAPCDGPTGIAMDRAANRIFSGCGKTSVVTDAATGKVVAEIPNGEGVDAFGWDQSQKLMYIPAGRDGNLVKAVAKVRRAK